MFRVSDSAKYSIAVLGMVIAGAVAMYAPPAASAEQFCWGSEISGSAGSSCPSGYRWISEASAKGAQHSVCLQVPGAASQCTSGPEAWVHISEPNTLGEAHISGRNTGPTHIFGEVF